jgi:hypothetical protein
MRELWRLRLGLAVCVLLAVLAALWSAYKVGVFPPSLSARELEMAEASTQVLIDTPKSVLLDARSSQTTLNPRAVLIGNVMASPPVRAYIARRTGVPAGAIQATTPLTQEAPRAISQPGNRRKIGDILRSTDQYRLNIQVNPTVSILDIYAEAPTAASAGRLANGAVDGLRDYLNALSVSQGIPDSRRVHLTPLGRARGEVINQGVRIQAALLSFLVMLLACCAALLFLARVKRGWSSAGDDAEGAPPPYGVEQLDGLPRVLGRTSFSHGSRPASKA